MEKGAELRIGRVTGIIGTADRSSVRGVEVDGGILESDAIVLAMGPWSAMAAEWMVLPSVYGRRSPSLIYDTGMDDPADALFIEYQQKIGGTVTVEVFQRAKRCERRRRAKERFRPVTVAFPRAATRTMT